MTLFDYWEETTTRAVDRHRRQNRSVVVCGNGDNNDDEENVDANIIMTESSSSSSSHMTKGLPKPAVATTTKMAASKSNTTMKYSTAPAPSSRGLTNRKHPWPRPKTSSSRGSPTFLLSMPTTVTTVQDHKHPFGSSVSDDKEEPKKKQDDQNKMNGQKSLQDNPSFSKTTTTTTTEDVKPMKSESLQKKTINLSVVTTSSPKTEEKEEETSTPASLNTTSLVSKPKTTTSTVPASVAVAAVTSTTTSGSRRQSCGVAAGGPKRIDGKGVGGLREIKPSTMTTIISTTTSSNNNKFKVQMAAAKFNNNNSNRTTNFVKPSSSSSMSSLSSSTTTTTHTYVPGIHNNNTNNKVRNVTSKPWTTTTDSKTKTKNSTVSTKSTTQIKTKSAGLIQKMLVPAVASEVPASSSSSQPVVKNNNNVFTPTPVDEPAAYLVYEPDSSGRLVEHYVDSNQTPTSNNNAIIGRWTASKGKKIATFKLKRNAGRNVLQGSCSAGVQGRKNYCAGWCQFVKSAYVQGSDDVTLWDCSGSNGQKGMPVDVYLYYDDDTNFPDHPQTMKLVEGVPISTMNLRAVATIPKNTPFYERHVRIGLHKWLQDGNNHGYSTLI